MGRHHLERILTSQDRFPRRGAAETLVESPGGDPERVAIRPMNRGENAGAECPGIYDIAISHDDVHPRDPTLVVLIVACGMRSEVVALEPQSGQPHRLQDVDDFAGVEPWGSEALERVGCSTAHRDVRALEGDDGWVEERTGQRRQVRRRLHPGETGLVE